MNHLVLTREALNVNEISNVVSADSCGAISIFVGTTRDSYEGKKVLSLEYEAYEPMALKQIQLICEELRRQWPDIENVAICHRLGLVGNREASVVIAISSPHRKTSLDAVATAVEDLKKRVPIWKKEIYKNDEFTWKENKESSVRYSDKLNLFNDSMCDIEDSHPLPIQLVQISASEDEIKRRIQCFVEKKRDEIDLCNIMDFTDVKIQTQTNEHKANTTREEESNDESQSCARVNSIVVKQEYSKCHLKVTRVKNNNGPQTRPDYLNTLDKLMVPTEKKILQSQFYVNEKENKQTCNNFEESVLQKYPALLERLENIESHVKLPKSKVKNIYQRLKVIEDRILYLESISPEYRHFLVEKSNFLRGPSIGYESLNDIKNTGVLVYERKIYSVGEIDTIIKSLEERDFNNLNSNIIE